MGTESPKEGHSMYASSDEEILFEPMEESAIDRRPYHPILPSITPLTESEGISTSVPTPPQTPDSNNSRLGSANGGVDRSCVARTDDPADVLVTPTEESCQQQGYSELAYSLDNRRLQIPPGMHSPVLNSPQYVQSFKLIDENVPVLNELEGCDREIIVGEILSTIRPYLRKHPCLVTELSTTWKANVHVQGVENCVREVLLAYTRTYGIRGLLYKWMEVDCTKDGCNHCNIVSLVLTKLPFLCLK